jgi:hypothetical protein
MRYGSECALLGWGAAAISGMLFAALEGSVAAMPTTRGPDPVSVDRALKGDRSPALPGGSRATPGPPAVVPKLPHGCIAGAGWRANTHGGEVAGRCIV